MLGARPTVGFSDPLIIQALAFRDGVDFARRRGFERVIFELDCQEVVKLWDGRSRQRSVIGPLLDEVRELNTGFSSFVVKFARRSANFAAHCCAKFAFYSLGVAGWLSMSPGFLVRADCNQNVLS